MLTELISFLGATGIAVIVFMIIVALADRPVYAFITALIFTHLLYFAYIIILNRILKRKEEKRTTDKRHE